MFSMIACNLACLSIAMLFYAWRDAFAPKPVSATARERVAYMLWVSAQRA